MMSEAENLHCAACECCEKMQQVIENSHSLTTGDIIVKCVAMICAIWFFTTLVKQIKEF